MAVRNILRMGDKTLQTIAAPITRFDDDLARLVTDLFETMEAADGAGLAAPQIGESVQVVVFGFDFNPRYPKRDPIAKTVLINPHITPRSAQKEHSWEACLSVPGLYGRVARFTDIGYTAYNVDGQPIQDHVSGFHARVIQHECDHLNGILYPQRMDDLSQFGFTQELIKSGNLPDC